MPEQPEVPSPPDGNGNAAINDQFFYPYKPPELTHVVDRYALQRARREGKEPPFCFPPNWPPLGWESRDTPLDDSPQAIKQWIDYYLHPDGPLRCSEAGESFYKTDCSHVVRDAWRVVGHLNALGRANLQVNEEPGWYGPRDAFVVLKEIHRQLFPPPALTDVQRAVLEQLDGLPPGAGLTGKEFLKVLRDWGFRIKQSTLTRHIMPTLKEYYGVRNRRGGGYYRTRRGSPGTC
jgi:hypothetical protein